jgi:hypothetical protein
MTFGCLAEVVSVRLSSSPAGCRMHHSRSPSAAGHRYARNGRNSPKLPSQSVSSDCKGERPKRARASWHCCDPAANDRQAVGFVSWMEQRESTSIGHGLAGVQQITRDIVSSKSVDEVPDQYGVASNSFGSRRTSVTSHATMNALQQAPHSSQIGESFTSSLIRNEMPADRSRRTVRTSMLNHGPAA